MNNSNNIISFEKFRNERLVESMPQVHMNPTIESIKGLSKRSKYGLRYVITKTNDLVVGDSEHHTHDTLWPEDEWHTTGYVSHKNNNYNYTSWPYTKDNKKHSILQRFEKHNIINKDGLNEDGELKQALKIHARDTIRRHGGRKNFIKHVVHSAAGVGGMGGLGALAFKGMSPGHMALGAAVTGGPHAAQLAYGHIKHVSQIYKRLKQRNSNIKEAIIPKYKALDKVDSIHRIHKKTPQGNVTLKGASFHREQMPTQSIFPNAQWNKRVSSQAIDKELDKIQNGTPRKHTVANVPLDKVVTNQDSISSRVVSKKLEGTWGKSKQPGNKLPIFVRLKNGFHLMINGNHRAAARAVRGFTHIRGHVIDSDIKESILSKRAAVAMISKLRKKHGKKKDQIYNSDLGVGDKDYHHDSDKMGVKINRAYGGEYKGMKVQKIPLDKIHSPQVSVSAQVVAKKIMQKWKNHEPRFPIFVKDKQTGHHITVDGNHRVATRKVRGFKHTWGFVVNEVVRDPFRARKLADYLLQRTKNKQPGEIGVKTQTPFPKYNPKEFNNKISNAPIQKLPIHKLKAMQNYVHRKGLDQHLDSNNKSPISVLRVGNDHYIDNGLHRVMAAKLRGETHIDAHVVDHEQVKKK